MTYIIDDRGVHFSIPTEQPSQPPADSIGCVFGSIVEQPPIPDDEAVEKCKEISAWVEAIQ